MQKVEQRWIASVFGGDGWLDGRTKSEPNKWSGDGNTVCYSREWQARSSHEAAELALNRQDIPFSQLSAQE